MDDYAFWLSRVKSLDLLGTLHSSLEGYSRNLKQHHLWQFGITVKTSANSHSVYLFQQVVNFAMFKVLTSALKLLAIRKITAFLSTTFSYCSQPEALKS